MDIKQYKKRIDNEIVDPLIEARNADDDCGFCSRHVMMLRKLVIKYMKTVNKIKNGNEEKILKHMKKLIFAINKINRNADYCMLESELGEELCYIIEDIAMDAGYPEIKEDITKPWREEW
ncbi:MAG: hypothetical protein IKA43_03430 [Clostridia bacterium]|nr:hypothetical protein [Clostridia bacterium]